MIRTFNIYTVEIAGRPTVALSAKNRAGAGKVLHAPMNQGALRSALRSLWDADGSLLWSGKEDDLSLRIARGEEQEKWEKHAEQAIDRGLSGSGPCTTIENMADGYCVFLVPLHGEPPDRDHDK